MENKIILPKKGDLVVFNNSGGSCGDSTPLGEKLEVINDNCLSGYEVSMLLSDGKKFYNVVMRDRGSHPYETYWEIVRSKEPIFHIFN